MGAGISAQLFLSDCQQSEQAMSETTLYERIGGETVIDGMVDDFYMRVLGDSELRPFFDGVSMERLRRMQKEFFAAALDGPMDSTDRDLEKAHHGLGITRHHVTRFVSHLIAVLDARDAISRKDAMDIIFQIAILADDVTGDAGGVDG